ncbi:Serpentine receptor class gamma [Trichostrongylus colubriformis]|uniref:Serpentine receptor class gamma n=1 Tax=Trichostrongylus colubriformis TaxID=6319 RepID=A0AAN8FK56_TRICO
MKALFLLSVIGAFTLCYCGPPGTSGSLDDPKIRADIEKEAKEYLTTFGYMSKPKAPPRSTDKPGEPSKYDLQTALKRFQEAFLLYPSGTVDVPTHSKMTEYRCANRDMYNGERLTSLPKKYLWNKKTLLWSISTHPPSLTLTQTREACDEAFEKWRKASGIDFVETKNASQSDIIITFADLVDVIENVGAGATKPVHSRIILERRHLWGYRTQEPRGISLFHTMLHEIGHVLGLPHNFYRGSIMYPILKPAMVPYGTLDDVPTVDRLSLSRLYGRNQTFEEKPKADLGHRSKCPKQIDSITYLTPSEWIVFQGDNVYRVRDRKFIDSGRKIQSIFPKSPGFVNATTTSDKLVLLFAERAIYGYEYDGVSFREAHGYPKELHGRVLFYPQAAFPLTNGSVILLSGNVFATYNVADNRPSILNDKSRYFPNLPDDLVSGVPKDTRSTEAYWMFDPKTVSDYDMPSKQVLQLESVEDFFKCA